MKKISDITWGTVFIIVGIILALNTLGITHINILFDGWWTLFIIIPCCIGLVNDNDKIGNLFGIFIGIALLLICQKIIDFLLLCKLVIPIVLILIGFSLIFKDKSAKNIKREIKELSNQKTTSKDYCSTFSSLNIKLDDESVEKYELNAIFGELNADLTDIKLKKDLLITACSIFGNIKLIAPEDTEIKVLSTPVFGSIFDNRKKQPRDKKNIIYLEAKAIFGGVEIK